MPQLDPYIFLSQFSWFFLIFSCVYYWGIVPKLMGSCEQIWVEEKMLKKDERGVVKPFLLKEEFVVNLNSMNLDQGEGAGRNRKLKR